MDTPIRSCFHYYYFVSVAFSWFRPVSLSLLVLPLLYHAHSRHIHTRIVPTLTKQYSIPNSIPHQGLCRISFFRAPTLTPSFLACYSYPLNADSAFLSLSHSFSFSSWFCCTCTSLLRSFSVVIFGTSRLPNVPWWDPIINIFAKLLFFLVIMFLKLHKDASYLQKFETIAPCVPTLIST